MEEIRRKGIIILYDPFLKNLFYEMMNFCAILFFFLKVYVIEWKKHT